MCGMGRVNFEDLKEHAVCSGGGPRFQLIVSWFWTIVSSFTQEEMARLLQFVTGCSQLPPGGFKELSPRFQIIAAPTHGMLPMAHTWWECMCLGDAFEIILTYLDQKYCELRNCQVKSKVQVFWYIIYANSSWYLTVLANFPDKSYQ